MAKIISTKYEEKKEYTICDDCPCMNNDHEYGESCNLGYDVEYIELNNAGRVHASTNCKLQHVLFEAYNDFNVNQEYKPKTISDSEVVHTYEYTKMEKTRYQVLENSIKRILDNFDSSKDSTKP